MSENQPRSWAEMREWCADLLRRRTGAGVEQWNARIAGQDFAGPDELRAWLAEQGVAGYSRMILVMERFGYPDFFVATANELIDAQYADRPQLRPIFEAVVQCAGQAGPVTVQARKGYVSLLTPRRTFAVVKASTRTRVDLGLRLDGQSPGGRLLPAGHLANATINLRIPLESVDQLDEEALELLHRAYRESAPLSA